MSEFKKLGLGSKILKVLPELGFVTPSEIQSKAIPILLKGDCDFIGLAQTGTGKTAAFGLPLLDLIQPHFNHTQVLILSPTRELCKQIANELERYSKYQHDINVVSVYGGANISVQIKQLKRKPHIIVATPGRLIDLIKRKAAKLDQLNLLVLDEADEMLNMGFKEEIDKILSYTPEEKIVWLFSATMPSEIKRIVKDYMVDPQEVRINPKNEVNKNIEHQYIVVKRDNKTEALCRFFDGDDSIKSIVFCRTKRDTQNLAEELLKRNYKVDALHGDLSQAQRDRVMNRFRKKQINSLIATDVAARGIDVSELTHVFHHSLPDQNEYYTHRSGRTARAGLSGKSIAFISGRDGNRIKELERKLKINFNLTKIPQADEVVLNRLENWAHRIASTDIKDIPKDVFQSIKDKFESLTKEELLARLINDQRAKMGASNSEDINISISKQSRDKGRRNQRNKSRGGRRFGGSGYPKDRRKKGYSGPKSRKRRK